MHPCHCLEEYAFVLPVSPTCLCKVCFLAGDERWSSRGWALLAVLLSLATTLMLVHVSYVHRDLETAMSGKDKGTLPLMPLLMHACIMSRFNAHLSGIRPVQASAFVDSPSCELISQAVFMGPFGSTHWSYWWQHRCLQPPTL